MRSAALTFAALVALLLISTSLAKRLEPHQYIRFGIRSAVSNLESDKKKDAFKPNVSTHTIFSDVAEYPYIHMTTVEQIPEKNVLVACWQTSRHHEGSDDQKIMCATSKDTGKTWTKPTDAIVAKDDVPVWGPSLFYHPGQDRLYMYYSQSVAENVRADRPESHWPGGDLMVAISTDMGNTWVNKTTLLPFDSPTRGKISKMTANKPIFLTTNMKEWALPFWQEKHTVDETGPECAGVMVTVDGGATYTFHGELGKDDPTSWFIENSIVAITGLPESSGFGDSALILLQFFRTKLNYIYQSLSMDGGKTWSSLQRTDIPNPDSKAYLAARPNLVDGTKGYPNDLLVACNPVTMNATHHRAILSVWETPLYNPTFNPTDGSTKKGDVVDEKALDFSSFLTVQDDKAKDWDYPTLLPLSAVKGGKNQTEQREWAVSYSAKSHTAAYITLFQSGPAATNGDDKKKSSPSSSLAIGITFGIIGVVSGALVAIVVVGFLRDRHNRDGSESDDEDRADESSKLV